MIRGVYHQVALFETFMQAQMFPFPRWNLKVCECGQNIGSHDNEKCPLKQFTRRKEVMQIAGGLRKAPWGYEYVFPEQSLAHVLTMLDIKPKNNRWSIGGFKSWALRKALGKGDAGHKVEPIPDYKPDCGLYAKVDGKLMEFPHYVVKEGIAIYPIGIKKDSKADVEKWGYEQEMI